jgi:hypothetical protein
MALLCWRIGSKKTFELCAVDMGVMLDVGLGSRFLILWPAWDAVCDEDSGLPNALMLYLMYGREAL